MLVKWSRWVRSMVAVPIFSTVIYFFQSWTMMKIELESPLECNFTHSYGDGSFVFAQAPPNFLHKIHTVKYVSSAQKRVNKQ